VYAISDAQLKEYLRMNFTEAILLARERPPYLVRFVDDSFLDIWIYADSLIQVHRCKEWEYDRSIMKDSVVTQWDRVCDDNWSRGEIKAVKKQQLNFIV
jgi:hypothetical protein